MNELNTREYWDEIYLKEEDQWNLNSPNPVFVHLIESKRIVPPGRMLIPGGGRGFDAVFAAGNGFEVTSVDISPEANRAAKALADEKGVSVFLAEKDFFELGKTYRNKYDILYEYVTICAVETSRRKELIKSFAETLKPGGAFISVLFPVDGRKGGPPFAIEEKEFYEIAGEYFDLLYYDRRIPSVKPRKENEVLFIFQKK